MHATSTKVVLIFYISSLGSPSASISYRALEKGGECKNTKTEELIFMLLDKKTKPDCTCPKFGLVSGVAPPNARECLKIAAGDTYCYHVAFSLWGNGCVMCRGFR
jgi:hypothetical protein